MSINWEDPEVQAGVEGMRKIGADPTQAPDHDDSEEMDRLCELVGGIVAGQSVVQRCFVFGKCLRIAIDEAFEAHPKAGISVLMAVLRLVVGQHAEAAARFLGLEGGGD